MLFFSSLSVVFLAHSIGYSDHIGLLVTLLVLSINSFQYKYAVAFIGTLICLFIHEAFLIIFFPVIFLSLLNETGNNDSHKVTMVAVFAFISLGATVFISASTLQKEDVTKYYENTQKMTHVELRRDAFKVLYRSGENNRNIMIDKWQDDRWYNAFIGSMSVKLPTAALIVIVMLIYLNQLNIHFFIKVLAVLASFSPLILNFFAWDMHRFNTLMILTSFLVFLNYTSYHSKPIRMPVVGGAAIMLSIVMCVVININASIPLFDGYQIKKFPFNEHVEYINNTLLGNDDFVYLPSL